MKKLIAFFLLLVLLVSCSSPSEEEDLESKLAQRYETRRKQIGLVELIEEDWDRAWLVNSFENNSTLPEELAELEAAQSPGVILKKGEELTSYKLPLDAVFVYPESYSVQAIEMNIGTIFTIEKEGGVYRLLYRLPSSPT
ncbi:MAG TPA: hypothetical protein VFD08_03955 [Clostridia bacterium]|nr:hypothetical protein [Clostridia bacterium]